MRKGELINKGAAAALTVPSAIILTKTIDKVFLWNFNNLKTSLKLLIMNINDKQL